MSADAKRRGVDAVVDAAGRLVKGPQQLQAAIAAHALLVKLGEAAAADRVKTIASGVFAGADAFHTITVPLPSTTATA